MVMGSAIFVRCLLCGHQVKVVLSKSNRPFYSCFTKDGGCGCQFYIREEPAYQLFAQKVKETMEIVDAMAPAPSAKPEEKAILKKQKKDPEQRKPAGPAKEETTRLTRAKAANCPRCEKSVSWDSLPPKQMSKPGLLDFIFEPPTVRVKECPLCGYVEELKEA